MFLLPPAPSLISCRLTIAVSLLFPIRSREHGQRAGSFITATPVSPLWVSTSFSSKWPWNQLHNRGLRNPKQQGPPSTELLHETKHLKKPNSSAHIEAPGSFFQPSVCWVLSGCNVLQPEAAFVRWSCFISYRECYPLSLGAAYWLPGQQFWLSPYTSHPRVDSSSFPLIHSKQANWFGFSLSTDRSFSKVTIQRLHAKCCCPWNHAELYQSI